MINSKKATTCDIEKIYLLSKQLIDDYEDIESIDYDKVLKWTRRKIEKFIDEYNIIYFNNEKAGYYRFFLNKDGEYEIDDLYIFPQYRSMGIGTRVINTCCSSVNAPVMLYVFIKNERAVALYKRLGFEVVNSVNGSRYIMKKESDKTGCFR